VDGFGYINKEKDLIKIFYQLFLSIICKGVKPKKDAYILINWGHFVMKCNE
jgi:hypothetical protein